MTRANKPGDPTSEATADQSTQTAGGLTGGRPTSTPGPRRDASGSRGRGEADIEARKRAARTTPRRYEKDDEAP